MNRITSLITRPLGLEGWEDLEPIILAALTTEEPMLLVGRHGTAKSFLLERLAEALGLTYRFYNASLINYDDLVGIPVPSNDRKSLYYIHTPTAIWDAEVVFVDEISRTRPELQNKLFPIIHEKRVQGIKLERLVYRWAAMNPPADPDADENEVYLGAEPLDAALADRFSYFIEAPPWEKLTNEAQRRMLLDQFQGRHEFPVNIRKLIQDAKARYEVFSRNVPSQLCDYLIALATQVRGDRALSSRRMTTLLRNILAIQAARITLAVTTDRDFNLQTIDWNRSAFLALLHGHPGLAQYGHLDRAALLAAHRHAWELAAMDRNDPWRSLLQVKEPVERLTLALKLRQQLDPDGLSHVILDCLSAEADQARRVALSLAIYLAIQQDGSVHATVVETLAKDIRRVLTPVSRKLQIFPGRPLNASREVGRVCSELEKNVGASTYARDAYTRNLLQALLPDGYASSSPAEIRDFFHNLWERFGLGQVRLPGAAMSS